MGEYATLKGYYLADRLQFIREGVGEIYGASNVPRGTGQIILLAETRRSAIRATYLFLALLYAREATGSVPDTLEELVPNIIPALPLDSIAGASFDYEPVATGFAIRSAACNTGNLGKPKQVELILR